jgi:hypothetical protein
VMNQRFFAQMSNHCPVAAGLCVQAAQHYREGQLPHPRLRFPALYFAALFQNYFWNLRAGSFNG